MYATAHLLLPPIKKVRLLSTTIPSTAAQAPLDASPSTPLVARKARCAGGQAESAGAEVSRRLIRAVAKSKPLHFCADWMAEASSHGSFGGADAEAMGTSSRAW